MKQPFLSATRLLIAAVITSTSLQAQKKNTVIKKTTETQNRSISIENDPTASGTRIIDYRDQHRYEIRMTDDKVIELTVDGNKISAGDFYKYNATIKKIRDQIKKDEEMAEMDRKQADEDRKQANEDRKQADEDHEQAEKDREQADVDRKQANADKMQADEDRKQADEDRKQALEDRKQADEDRVQAGKDREQAVLDRKQAEEDRILMKSMMSDLVKEKIVKSESEVISLILKDGELSVNGIKQSSDMAQKFSTKYLKNPRTEIKYSNSTQRRGLSITSNDNK